MHYSIEPSNEDECAIPAVFQLTHFIGDGGGDVPSIRMQKGLLRDATFCRAVSRGLPRCSS